MMGLPNIYEALVVSILSALGVSTLLLLFTWQLGRRLHVFRELSLTFVVASLVLGLATYTFLAPGETPQTDRFLLFLLYLLAAATILGVAGLYLFRVYLISNRGLLLPPILHRFAMAAVYLIAILAALKATYPGQDLSFILGASAVTSVVLGLALQPILTNLFAGIVIGLEQPFRINDWIRLGDRDGQVVKITWRTTHLRNRDNDHLVIPNSQIADQELINYFLPNPLHMERIYVGAHYRTPPYRVRQALKRAAARVPGVLEKPSPDVFLRSFDDSSINYELRVWIQDIAALQRIAGEVRAETWEEFKRHDITIPFPIRTLEIEPSARTVELTRAHPDEVREREPAATLFVKRGPDQGRSHSLECDPVTVGRADSCDFTLSDRSTSAEHFRIGWTDQGFVLKDLGSQHGTLINGVKTTDEILMRHLDRIHVGDTEIVFESHA